MKLHQSQVADWMTRDPITVSTGASLADAYDQMQESNVRRLPVVERGELEGIVTLSDVLRTMPPMGDEADRETRLMLTTRSVRDVMAYRPVTINPEATLLEAAERMLEYQVSGLPVVDGSRLVGIITESDVFRLVIEALAQGSEDA